MTEQATETPPKRSALRPVVGWLALLIMLQIGIFMAGGFDWLVLKRVKSLAQDSSKQWDNTWLGIGMLQYPEDLMLYQELITELKPDYVVECGTAMGGLTLYLSSLLENVNPDAKILTIDIEPKYWQESLEKIKDKPAARLLGRIEFIAGSSTSPEVLSKITAQVKGKKVLVLLDSAHGKGHVLDELRLYSPLVPVGSYIIVNDTQLDYSAVLEYGPGPLAAVKEFTANNPNFTIDRSRERFYLTCNASGFLKREK